MGDVAVETKDLRRRLRLDSYRIRAHVERVVYEDGSGTMRIRLTSDPGQFSLRIWISRFLVSLTFAADTWPAR